MTCTGAVACPHRPYTMSLKYTCWDGKRVYRCKLCGVQRPANPGEAE